MPAQPPTPVPETAAVIEAMRAQVASGPEIYRPGAFWSQLLETNLRMLRDDGIENFKRTVSNNYFNWMVTSPADPQARAALLRWLRRPRRLRVRMEPADRLRMLTRDDAFALSRHAAFVYRTFVALAWERAREDDRLGLTTRLQEPEAGNPIRIWSGSRRISQDLANSILECNFVAASGLLCPGVRVAELGAGYGRLAHAYAAAVPDVAYAIFDIPPALAVSQWYLTQVLGPERVVAFAPEAGPDALRPGAVAFFTPDQLDRFPDGAFDVTQTISTLPEMPARQAERFLARLAATSSGAVFLKQWRSWRNEADGASYDEAGYALGSEWQLAQRRTDPLQPAFFNRLWTRC